MDAHGTAPHAHDGPAPGGASTAARANVRAARISVVVGIVLLVTKVIAWQLTDSQTIFSDAMESIVNVVAAAAALVAVSVAAMPADENHPYGHGKIEHVTAGIEGGAIAVAGCLIVWEAVRALIDGHAPRELDTGLLLVAAAGVANLLLGVYLVSVGRKHGSVALVADGKHVISDFWTSLGAVTGLLLVRFTGQVWIDAATAIVFAMLLFWTGAKLLRESARGLMDEADPKLLEEVCAGLEAERQPGIIEVHDLRAISVGGHRHVDLHVVVPEFWSVAQAHEVMDSYERRIIARGERSDLQFHVDPCEQAYCARCDLAECAVRRAPLTARRPVAVATAVRGPEPPGTQPVHADPGHAPGGR